MSHACECKACVSKRAPTKDAITASGFFSEEQLGPNQSFTPEGYLLCEAVPIARTGTQDYAGIELPDIEDKDGVIVVERDEDAVFAPETIASFLGKPVTINHPDEPVTPDNWAYLSKGAAHNIRRGQGDQSHLLIADLLITDKSAINEIRNNGLKEISCGYDAEYQQIAPGRARQASIVGNHVALVKNARCGPVCSVQDSSKVLLGDEPMAVKKGATSFADKMRKLFMARDSEGFEKALEEVNDEESGGNLPAIHIHMPTKDAESEESKKDDEKEETKDEGPDLAAVLTKFDERLSSLESSVKALTKDSVEEEKKEETKDDDGDEDGDGDMTEDSDDEEEKKDDEKKSTNDSAAFRDEFQDAKARAEILAPGVKLPTYDAKAESKKTADSICVLRRRALKAALTNDNADLVRAIVGDADVSKMDCAAAKMAFHASSELVKRKNMTVARKTTDAAAEAKDINQRHAEFWANRK